MKFLFPLPLVPLPVKYLQVLYFIQILLFFIQGLRIEKKNMLLVIFKVHHETFLYDNMANTYFCQSVSNAHTKNLHL